ncbi:MAG: class I SAM-dependent methyltransferase [Rhodobacteraceae bacterium]|nr:class I SAM-dependent methyltransferase [Paracoccaceae bacterium]
MTERAESYSGICSVCGTHGSFRDMAQSIRETYQCTTCRASMRERVTADAILAMYARGRSTCLVELAEDPNFSNLDIFEPGISGAYRTILKPLPSYKNSFYWDDIPFGEERDGVRNEDLQALTFRDASFDLVISSDIFEHVRHPWTAFRELRRVLRTGGCHIFSIPVMLPMRTHGRLRVDTSGPEDVHILEPVYHGDGKGGRSLVYTDFGADLYDKLERCGYKTVAVRSDHTDEERRKVIAFICLAV